MRILYNISLLLISDCVYNYNITYFIPCPRTYKSDESNLHNPVVRYVRFSAFFTFRLFFFSFFSFPATRKLLRLLRATQISTRCVNISNQNNHTLPDVRQAGVDRRVLSEVLQPANAVGDVLLTFKWLHYLLTAQAARGCHIEVIRRKRKWVINLKGGIKRHFCACEWVPVMKQNSVQTLGSSVLPTCRAGSLSNFSLIFVVCVSPVGAAPLRAALHQCLCLHPFCTSEHSGRRVQLNVVRRNK